MSLNNVPAGKSLPDDLYVVIEILRMPIQLNMKLIKTAAQCLLTALCLHQCSTHATMVM